VAPLVPAQTSAVLYKGQLRVRELVVQQVLAEQEVPQVQLELHKGQPLVRVRLVQVQRGQELVQLPAVPAVAVVALLQA